MRGGGQIRRRRKRRPGKGRRVYCKPQGGEASRRLASPRIAAGASVRSAFCKQRERSTSWFSAAVSPGATTTCSSEAAGTRSGEG
ncbi:hypothetical protein E2320_009097 [Naja naja]|nr:hypothetical protein E2320_009097 [Naja naja]